MTTSPPDSDRNFSDVSLVTHKLQAVMPVPVEMLMDCGAIPDTRTYPPLTRRMRLRRHFRNAVGRIREHAGQRAYERITGYRFPDSE
jgi:hypothetical protein